MSRSLKVIIDPRSVSPAASIRVAARSAPLLIIGGRALADLAAELGSPEAAGAFLLELAEDIGHPLAVNMPTGADTSSTAFISPRSWSAERLQGWVAGRHQELEDAFGAVSRMTADVPRGGRQ